MQFTLANASIVNMIKMNKCSKIILSMLVILSLTGCASDNASTAKLHQAIAAKAYNDFSACYGITDLESDTASTAYNNADNAAYIVNNTANNIINARGHFHSFHHAPHSYNGKHYYDSHSSHSYYTAPREDSSSNLSDKIINRANENRSKSELIDGTNHDRLITNDGTRSWYSNHNYYIPRTYTNHANNAGTNDDTSKDNVAYFFLKYILNDNSDNNENTSLNVNWKYDDKNNTGSIVLFTKSNVKYAKLQASNGSSANSSYNTACTAVNLPLPNDVSKAIGKYNN